MSKKKVVLNKEQMQTLADLGIDTSDASLIYLGHNQFAMNEREDDLVKCGLGSYVYTLDDVIMKLPKEIHRKCVDADKNEENSWKLRLHIGCDINALSVNENVYYVQYFHQDCEDTFSILEYMDLNLIDVAFEMLVRLIKEGYVKK